MKISEGTKRFLRDAAVNLIGVIIAAVISIFIAFWVYDYRSQKQCNSILEMVRQESIINMVNSRLILKFLTPIVKHKKNDLLTIEAFTNRLQSKATNMASESSLVLRFTSPLIRFEILAHSDNLNNLNANIDGFNEYIINSRASKKISYSYIKEWAALIIERINSISRDSKKISNNIEIYLNKQ